MSLRDAPLLYVFYETASLSRQQELYEYILGLPVIENPFHPSCEYPGFVKYDGGQTVLSLNLSPERRFQRNASDGLITVLSVDSEEAVRQRLRRHGYTPSQQPSTLFTDDYGHHYIFRSTVHTAAGANGTTCPAVQELHLMVSDFASSLAFYRDTLGLEILDQTESTARFVTGTVDLFIQQSRVAPDGRSIRYHTYLLVFYIDDLLETREALIQRGMAYCPCSGSGDIGRTAHFADPSGHIYCLYEPSKESLTWGNDPKVMEIMTNGAVRKLTFVNGD